MWIWFTYRPLANFWHLHIQTTCYYRKVTANSKSLHHTFVGKPLLKKPNARKPSNLLFFASKWVRNPLRKYLLENTVVREKNSQVFVLKNNNTFLSIIFISLIQRNMYLLTAPWGPETSLNSGSFQDSESF